MMMYMALMEDPGHISLFEQIYQTYRGAMFGIAVAVLRDHHLAEDAVSEAFLKIAKNINKISALDGQVRRDYIVIITRNSALDLYRQRQKQGSVVDFLEELGRCSGMPEGLMAPLYKVAGIAVVVKIGGGLCADAGESALAAAVETAGTVCALAAALPLLRTVMELLTELMA